MRLSEFWGVKYPRSPQSGAVSADLMIMLCTPNTALNIVYQELDIKCKKSEIIPKENPERMI
jgi:hypothetical protein